MLSFRSFAEAQELVAYPILFAWTRILLQPRLPVCASHVLIKLALHDDDEASLGGEVVASSPGPTTAVRSSSAPDTSRSRVPRA
jgi:hypothetical protein